MTKPYIVIIEMSRKKTIKAIFLFPQTYGIIAHSAFLSDITSYLSSLVLSINPFTYSCQE